MDKKVYEFISEKSWEKILELKTCKICNATFPIFEWDRKLLDKISPKIWDEILDIGIICEESSRIFRITKTELDFYRKYQIPLPKKHFQTRQIEAFKQRPSWELYIRKCEKCSVEMLTIYSEEHRPHMYCEECFNEKF